MIYAMSDIHGCLDELKEKMELIRMSRPCTLIFLGDYMDFGSKSGQVLRYIYELQETYGSGRVRVLLGNHEDWFLGWLDMYLGSRPPRDLIYDTWIRKDAGVGYRTFRTLVTEEQMDELIRIEKKADFADYNITAARMIMKTNGDLIEWMRILRKTPFYETDTQIFVHAGVDEEAGDEWKYGTSRAMFFEKYPAVTGRFCKTIIAGHVGTGTVSGDRNFHDIYFDGQSHYYIDGSVYDDGKLLLLKYDEETGKYYQVDKDGEREVRHRKA